MYRHLQKLEDIGKIERNQTQNVAFILLTCGFGSSSNQDSWDCHQETSERTNKGQHLSASGRFGGKDTLEIYLPWQSTTNLKSKKRTFKFQITGFFQGTDSPRFPKRRVVGINIFLIRKRVS